MTTRRPLPSPLHLLFSFLFPSSVRFVSRGRCSFSSLQKLSEANPAMVRRPSIESTSTQSAFELLSPPSGSQVSEFSSDGDEIVWSVSSLSLSDPSFFSPRSEDYVVLGTPSVASDLQPFVEDDLISNPPIPSHPPTPQPPSPSRRSRRKRTCPAHAQQQPAQGQAPPQSPSKASGGKAPPSPQPPKRRRKRSEKRNDSSPPRGRPQNIVVSPLPPPPVPGFTTRGLGARSVVDDVSERGDDNDSVYGDGKSESFASSTVYDKAVHYINWCVFAFAPPPAR